MTKRTLSLKFVATGRAHKFCQMTADKDNAFAEIKGREFFYTHDRSREVKHFSASEPKKNFFLTEEAS